MFKTRELDEQGLIEFTFLLQNSALRCRTVVLRTRTTVIFLFVPKVILDPIAAHSRRVSEQLPHQIIAAEDFFMYETKFYFMETQGRSTIPSPSIVGHQHHFNFFHDGDEITSPIKLPQAFNDLSAKPIR